jgi:hypothetical protein
LPKAVKKEKWAKGMMVKGRNEPACIVHVAHAVAKIKGLAVEEVCEAYVSLVANYDLELTFPAYGTILSICSDLEYYFQTRPRRECRRVYWLYGRMGIACYLGSPAQ